MKERIGLIGAGLAGSLLSIYLAKRGYQVDVYERRPDMRKVDIGGGRSINLALSTRGIHALRDAGLLERIMQIAIPMKGRMIHPLDGELVFQRYGKDDTEVIYATSRSALNVALMDEAERHENVTIHFNAKCTGMDFETGEIRVFDELTGASRAVIADTAIGTDGSASAIRTDMLKRSRFNFSQHYLDYGYKELVIPPAKDGGFALEKNALHIWPRGSYMLIALPNIDGSFTVTFFFPFEGEESFSSLDSDDKVLAFFGSRFPDAVAVMPDFIEDYRSNPVGSMVTVKCEPWHVDGKVALLGDAAHAIVPFFGQGMNCAFEDCTYLDECLGKREKSGEPVSWSEVYAEYESLRKVNTDAIADLAVENFVEMRDHVANPKFLLKKKVEHLLEERFPGAFTPKYSMVTFHRTPYAIAQRKGAIQDKILTELCEPITDEQDVDWTKAGYLISTLLKEV